MELWESDQPRMPSLSHREARGVRQSRCGLCLCRVRFQGFDKKVLTVLNAGRSTIPHLNALDSTFSSGVSRAFAMLRPLIQPVAILYSLPTRALIQRNFTSLEGHLRFLNGFKKARLLAIGLFLLLGCTSAFGQFSISITLDEKGNGLFTNTNAFSSGLPSAMMADPGPGGIPSALFYGMLNPPGLTLGDVVINENGTGLPGDLLRFDPSLIINGTTGGVFIYSLNDGDGDLADVGLPTGRNTNLITLTESAGETISYTPTSGQPGFVSGAGGPVTYTFTSSDNAAPEPTTVLMLSGGLAILWVGIRQKTRRSKVA